MVSARRKTNQKHKLVSEMEEYIPRVLGHILVIAGNKSQEMKILDIFSEKNEH